MTHSIRLITTNLAAVAVVMTLTAAEVGAKAKVYPASFCQVHGSQRHGLGGEMVSHFHLTKNGTLVNQSTESVLKVVCPIIRDFTTNTNGLEKIMIFARNNNRDWDGDGATCGGATMYCRLRSVEVSDDTDWDPEPFSGTGDKCFPMDFTGERFEPFYFNLPTSDSINNVWGDYPAGETSGYLLYCRIPPREAGQKRSGLSFYAVKEYE